MLKQRLVIPRTDSRIFEADEVTILKVDMDLGWRLTFGEQSQPPSLALYSRNMINRDMYLTKLYLYVMGFAL